MTATSLRRPILAGATLLLAGLVGIGIGAAVTSTGGAGAPDRAGATQATAPATGTAAAAATVDNAALAALVEQAVDPAAAPTAGGAAPAGLAAIRNRLGRWQALVRAIVTVNLPQAGLQTFEVDHGTISAVTGTGVTLSEAGGKDVTLTTTSSTRVRKDARQAQLSDLSAGDEAIVFSRIGGGGSTTALAIVVPRPAGSAAAPSASPSPQAPTN